jgi:hypothetical protein
MAARTTQMAGSCRSGDRLGHSRKKLGESTGREMHFPITRWSMECTSYRLQDETYVRTDVDCLPV